MFKNSDFQIVKFLNIYFQSYSIIDCCQFYDFPLPGLAVQLCFFQPLFLSTIWDSWLLKLTLSLINLHIYFWQTYCKPMRIHPGVIFCPDGATLRCPADMHVWTRYHVATSISLGRNIMTGWHDVTRRDGISRRDGIALVCHMSVQERYDKNRSSQDWKWSCLNY